MSTALYSINHQQHQQRQHLTEIQRNLSNKLFKELTSIPEEQQPVVPCRNRPYLPGSNSSNFPKTLRRYIHPEFKCVDINQEHRSTTAKELGNLLRPFIDSYLDKKNNKHDDNLNPHYSALLIKNLPISSASDFDDFITGCDYEQMNYTNGSGFREPLSESVYTASDEPAVFTIEPHNEMSYLKTFPAKVLSTFAYFIIMKTTNI